MSLTQADAAQLAAIFVQAECVCTAGDCILMMFHFAQATWPEIDWGQQVRAQGYEDADRVEALLAVAERRRKPA